MAQVLILSLVFPPDSVSTAQIMGELAQDLQQVGHTVTVLTTQPHYNRDLESEARQPLRSVWGPLLFQSNFGGLAVYHTFMPRKGRNLLLRLLAWLGFHSISLLAACTLVPPPEVILAPSPPLTIGVCAWLIGKFHRAPYIYNVQEIYPDIAITLGTLRHGGLIRLAYALEKFVYARAGAVTVIAPRMRNRLLAKGTPPAKVHFIPNFVDVSDFQPLPKDNPFSRQHRLADQFVVSYAGNLGPAQNLEMFICAAAQLRAERHITFVMMGDGMLREALEQQVRDLALENFKFLPYQPYSRMPQIYSASDMCLVSLAARAGSDAVPSKVYRIMACARPVLAVADPQSDLAQLVSGVGCGFVVPPDDPEALANAILAAARASVDGQRRGELGRQHVMAHYARPVVTAHYHRLIESLRPQAANT